VSEERRELRTATVPIWRRFGFDVALLLAAVTIETVAIRNGALDPPVGSVYAGLAISLPAGLLPAPLIVWLGGLLLCVRAVLAIVAHIPAPSTRRFGAVVPGISSRGLRRRSGDLASGIIGLGLVVALGVGLGLFAATYEATKADLLRLAIEAAAEDYKIGDIDVATNTFATQAQWYSKEGGRQSAGAGDYVQIEGGSVNVHFVVQVVEMDDKSVVVTVTPKTFQHVGGSPQPRELAPDDPNLPGWVTGRTESLQLAIYNHAKQFARK
jgi:hypothetical protein